jgi:tetratricopeptide (TPR) repeat protein
MHPDFAEVHRHLGMSYRGMGLYEKAIAEFRKAVTLSGNSPFYLAVLGNVYGLAGQRREAREILSQLEQLGKERYIDPAIMARFYAGSGDIDRAFRWLGEAFEERSIAIVKLGAQPDWDPLRSDPRFQDLLRRVGLPQANGN